jgi:hypothetical protein
MAKRGFNSFDHFRNEILFERSGPLSSAVEDMADEMYNADVTEELDGMWDATDADDE